MNAASFDIANYLVSLSSFDFVLGENLHIGREPSQPPNSTVIFDTMGSKAPQLNLTDQGYEYANVQIRVRNISYNEGIGLVVSLKNELHGLNNMELGGSYYALIHASSGPAMLDWDENSRARLIVNFECQRRSL